MKQVSLLIKPASSNCNLACSYCFYNDVSEHRKDYNRGIMNKETSENCIKKAFEYVGEKGKVTFSFQGGEPTVAKLDYFRRFVELVNKHIGNRSVNYALQTNGTLIDQEWCDFFKQHHFLIGVSLDGYESNMDQFRYDIQKKSVYFKVLNGIRLLKKNKVDFNILTVVSASLAKHPEALYKFFRNQGFNYIQLIPCLPSLNGGEKMDEEALTPELYSSFYKKFFDCWIKDIHSKEFMEVNLFMNILEMMNGRPPYQCGYIGRCFAQYVVEGDGSVYPCDFYVLDHLLMGNVNSHSLEELYASDATTGFLKEETFMKELCTNCSYKQICHGGCKRQNVCYLDNQRCAYQEFLDYAIPQLSRLR